MSPLSYDAGLERISSLCEAIEERGRNEATTRLQLIDRLLFECLGWSRDRAELEDYEGREYADYVLDSQARLLVVEAKKEGTWFDLPTGLHSRSSLRALYGLGDPLSSALEQVERYAQGRGAPYAAVCNGHQIVAFIASRQDGVPPREGRALLFESPRALVERFGELWDALGPSGCAARRLTRILSQAGPAPPPKLSEATEDYPGSARMGERHLMLSTLSVLFLPDFVRDDEHEREFLEECYSPPGAYSQLAMVSRSVLQARYSLALGEELNVSLEEARSREGLSEALVAEVAESTAGREPLILLGDIGVGKTMFLRRLLRVDAERLAERAVLLYIDLGRSAVLGDLTTYIVAEIQNQLLERYDVDIDADDFLRGTYHAEVRRFATGVNAPLRDTDAQEFKRREVDYLLGLTKNPEEHLRRSFAHLVTLRSQQIIVVLDNLDQRLREDQEQVFLIAETFARSWPCTVFVTLRPQTFHASRVRGALTGYQPRAFTVDPPRIDRAMTKRLEFGSKYYQAEGRLPQWMGWTAASDDLGRYIDVLLKSFKRSEPLQRLIVNLSGGNARRALELMTTFIASPHGAHTETLDRNAGDGDYLVPHHHFLRAVLLGDHAHYDPRSSLIPNLFDISTSDPREHFLALAALGLLQRSSEARDNEGYFPLEDLLRYFADLGFLVDQVQFALRRALDGAFVEALPPEGEPRAVRPTTAGIYGHRVLSREFQYYDAVVLDTPITDGEVRQDLRVVHAIRQRLERAEVFLAYLDGAWIGSDLESTGLFDWPEQSRNVRADIEYIASRL